MSAPSPHGAPGRRDWMRQVACRDKPARWFTDPADQIDVTRALDTCQTCKVRPACLATTLTHAPDADVGVWGGTTEHTRRCIHTGHLDVDDLPQPRPRPDPDAESFDEARQPAPRREPSTSEQTCRPWEIPRLPQPELTVGRDRRGDYVSADGRVAIFRIHGDPPWMLAIDQRPIRRTETLRQARQAAWKALHPEASLDENRDVIPASRR